MRKVIVSIMVSLDGYIEGSEKEIDWHVWNEEMSGYMIDFFASVDTLLFGRVTYELMADFWPTPAAATEDQTIARYMNDLPKIVFSRTLLAVDWTPCTLIKEDIKEKILQLKKQPGKDMVIFGGAHIISTFIELGLIDEFRLIVNPVILGKGTPLFKDIREPLWLRLVRSQQFDCGNVLLMYCPDQKHK